jgi:hypothetical protein
MIGAVVLSHTKATRALIAIPSTIRFDNLERFV